MHDATDPFSDLANVTFLGDEYSSGLAYFSYWWDADCHHHMQVRSANTLSTPVVRSLRARPCVPATGCQKCTAPAARSMTLTLVNATTAGRYLGLPQAGCPHPINRLAGRGGRPPQLVRLLEQQDSLAANGGGLQLLGGGGAAGACRHAEGCTAPSQ